MGDRGGLAAPPRRATREPRVSTVVYDLASLLVGRWFGPEAAKASLFVDGIAGIAGSRLGSAPSIEEADEAVGAELRGG